MVKHRGAAVAVVDTGDFPAMLRLAARTGGPAGWSGRITRPDGTAVELAAVNGVAEGQMDWRADYGSLTYRMIDVPADVVAGMHRYLEFFGLAFGVFDFGITQDGWVAYECNPNGQWMWLAEATGAPVAGAFADVLAGGAAA